MKTLTLAAIIATMATALHADEPAELFRNYPDMYIYAERIVECVDWDRAFRLSPPTETPIRSEKLAIAFSWCVQRQTRGFRLRHPRDPLDGR